MRSKGMPHSMRTGTGWQSCALTVLFNEQLHATRAETTTTVVHKECSCLLRLRCCHTHLKIGLEGLGRRLAKEDLALAPAFPLHPQGAGGQIHVLYIQCYQFTHTNPRGIQQFQNGLIAQRQWRRRYHCCIEEG